MVAHGTKAGSPTLPIARNKSFKRIILKASPVFFGFLCLSLFMIKLKHMYIATKLLPQNLPRSLFLGGKLRYSPRCQISVFLVGASAKNKAIEALRF